MHERQQRQRGHIGRRSAVRALSFFALRRLRAVNGEVQRREKAEAEKEYADDAHHPHRDLGPGKPVRYTGEKAREHLVRPGKEQYHHHEHRQRRHRALEHIPALAALLHAAERAEGLAPVGKYRPEEQPHRLAHAARVGERRRRAAGEREKRQHRAAEDEDEVHEPHVPAAPEHAERRQQPHTGGKADAVPVPARTLAQKQQHEGPDGRREHRRSQRRARPGVEH